MASEVRRSPCRSTGSGTTLFRELGRSQGRRWRREEDGTGRYIVAPGNEKLLQISRWGKLLVHHGRQHVAADARSYVLLSRRRPLRVSNEKKKYKKVKMRTQRTEEEEVKMG